MATIFSPVSPSRTTCGTLLVELQKIWDEIGEGDSERDKMLLHLEQECLDIYRKKVDITRKYKADLLQTLADVVAEISQLVSALGETVSFSRGKGTIKQQISAVKPALEDLRSKKQGRLKEFSEIQLQIARIYAEIAGTDDSINSNDPQVDENDLTVNKLGELKSHLKELQNEKSLRLQKVNSSISIIHDLSVVMSIDFSKTIEDVDRSLIDSENGQSKSISNDTLARLTSVIHSLKQEKQQRLQKLQGLGCRLTQLWDLMDTPPEEQRKWDHITLLISASADEDLRSGSLALEVIEQAEIEVERLNVYKTSKLKELVFKRQNELEEIYRGVHMDVDGDAARQTLTSLTESGNVDLSELLSSMDEQITKAKEHALSRKDILDKVEKWRCASEEEQWLDEYERDENRYNAGRGAHKNLKRAEKARILVGKVPSIVDNLTAKVKAWELENGVPFLYDKAPLLKTLQDYTDLRQEREEEKRRSREQKRQQEQVAAEQEALYGSRPKKPLGQNTSANTMAGTPNGRRGATPGRHVISSGKERRESRFYNASPVNYVALHKDDSASRGS
ncbi:65-kDa microtubule-associated protein 5 [Mercurialis annua]|uniref:65-kDa microtubule-associated protein 5 n=1 Tax=Mercurialis annua TaxID=3986 RepID=UPI00215EB209|nr:65-kDa microtubule-associated protein 5 [Mercurialis annua]XP_050235215.1 65-kDa microtubule-associated protein 5 [Mercurialis annua]